MAKSIRGWSGLDGKELATCSAMVATKLKEDHALKLGLCPKSSLQSFGISNSSFCFQSETVGILLGET